MGRRCESRRSSGLNSQPFALKALNYPLHHRYGTHLTLLHTLTHFVRHFWPVLNSHHTYDVVKVACCLLKLLFNFFLLPPGSSSKPTTTCDFPDPTNSTPPTTVFSTQRTSTPSFTTTSITSNLSVTAQQSSPSPKKSDQCHLLVSLLITFAVLFFLLAMLIAIMIFFYLHKSHKQSAKNSTKSIVQSTELLMDPACQCSPRLTSGRQQNQGHSGQMQLSDQPTLRNNTNLPTDRVRTNAFSSRLHVPKDQEAVQISRQIVEKSDESLFPFQQFHKIQTHLLVDDESHRVTMEESPCKDGVSSQPYQHLRHQLREEDGYKKPCHNASADGHRGSGTGTPSSNYMPMVRRYTGARPYTGLSAQGSTSKRPPNSCVSHSCMEVDES